MKKYLWLIIGFAVLILGAITVIVLNHYRNSDSNGGGNSDDSCPLETTTPDC